ncbi:DUF417 domain-containing protein [Streptomyces sp. NBC_00454]|uniref:DUF417 domain-containing protein n=1 Tax=Streptomyces sp. NBC_00454 TaxID=2975747 RepID=UPI0030E3BFF2
MRRSTTVRKPSGSLSGRLAAFYRRHEAVILRVSVGLLYVWFGVLKFFPALSPAEGVALRAMTTMTFHFISPDICRPALATMEVLVGLGLILGAYPRLTLTVFLVHMAGVFSTLAILPGEVWRHPFVPSLEGQYILKNLVLVAGCLSAAAAGAAKRHGLREAQGLGGANPPWGESVAPEGIGGQLWGDGRPATTNRLRSVAAVPPARSAEG